MNQGLLGLIRREYDSEIEKKRNFENIKKLFDMRKSGDYTLDNQTWDDLDMDKVYSKLDRTYSSLGEAALYSMLRNPLMDEEKLRDRSKLVHSFKENSRLREKLLYIFYKLGTDRKNSFLDMIENELTVSRVKYFIYTFIGKILPFIILFMGIFMRYQYLVSLVFLSFLTVYINSQERNTIKSNGILYLRSIIVAAKKIAATKDESINNYTEKIEVMLKRLKDIDRGTRLIGFANMCAGLFEPLSVIFLLEESAYYAISDKITKERETLMELYHTLGELEAFISISGYQHNLQQQYSEPSFTKTLVLNIDNGVHPLIEEPVANSISISSKGIVLTGTNMSGKSTFLRMLGINILLAQTFDFVLAKQYEASFFNIVSSISPNDDLTQGKSFYMAEAEAILRIIRALEKEMPVFCPIDEIFRGTNPVERISMSAEILAYINQRKAISIVATHDRELADILKDTYEFYYFSENVDSSKGLSFDYKLKKGVSQTRNAIRLLEYLNYPQTIVEKSYKRSKSIEGFI